MNEADQINRRQFLTDCCQQFSIEAELRERNCCMHAQHWGCTAAAGALHCSRLFSFSSPVPNQLGRRSI
ncbi:hypothetical protein T01_7753 [Trichinella spiralis]|uniref:Uncharacterized protein n=1 Tax=Trichinella spiralis TaxID=6334 RepID=A0A0V1BF60_TRISP|nr:hypothetical protein T01_7753 [Trichinella spiralis]